MSKYFTITKKIPITGASQHVEYAIDDLLFDWVEIEIPSGGARLMSVSGYFKSKLDATQTIVQRDFSLIFANKATAGSFGAENAIIGYETFPDNILGTQEIEDADYSAAATNGRMYALFTSHKNKRDIVLNAHSDVKASSVGYDKFFVAAAANEAISWESTFTINDTNIATVSPGDQLVVAGTSMDAQEHFRAGDVLIADDDAPIGTIKSVDDANTMTMTEAIPTGVLTHGDDVYLKHPLVLTFHFEH